MARTNRNREDPTLAPGSRALAEYIVLFFVALGIILLLASVLVRFVNDVYSGFINTVA